MVESASVNFYTYSKTSGPEKEIFPWKPRYGYIVPTYLLELRLNSIIQQYGMFSELRAKQLGDRIYKSK
jgi:hypothetical protein